MTYVLMTKSAGVDSTFSVGDALLVMDLPPLIWGGFVLSPGGFSPSNKEWLHCAPYNGVAATSQPLWGAQCRHNLNQVTLESFSKSNVMQCCITVKSGGLGQVFTSKLGHVRMPALKICVN